MDGFNTTDTLRLAPAPRHFGQSITPTPLPSELLRASVDRLKWLGVAFALTFVVMYALNRLLSPTPELAHLRMFQVLTAAALLLGSSISYLAWSRRLPDHITMDIGLLFQIAAGLVISLSETVQPFPEGVMLRAHSMVSMWLMIYVLVIPTTALRAFAAAAGTAIMGPLGLLFNTLIFGHRLPPIEQCIIFYVNTVLAALWSFVISRLIYRLGQQAQRAKAMGAYELVSLIGRGGMGEVWRARHRMLVRESALKLIRPESVCNPGEPEVEAARRRFEREARATAALHSPHTVSIHDYGIAEDGSFYYVMELLEGMDLDTFVREHGPQPASRVIYILRQVCDSLAEAHALGLTHRDIKPRNIFLCRMGLNFDFVKVLDFGLVKIRSSVEQTQLTQQGVTTGTPAFMPPELAVGSEDIDGRTDIYALGCVAYWLLTGGLVFQAPNALAMALEHVRSTPEPPSRRTEIDIPADLEELILQCLEKDPNNRPQSTREISQRLTAIAAARDWSNDHAERWWQLHQPQMRETIGVFAEFSGQVTAS